MSDTFFCHQSNTGRSLRPGFASKTRLSSLAILLITLGVSTLLPAQQPAAPAAPAEPAKKYEEMDLQELFEAASNLMEDGKFEEALKPLTLIIDDYGGDAMETYGPMFGVMYYRKGFCLKNLKKFEEALEMYKICYDKFPNKAGAANKNPVWELSRLEMGIVKQAMGKYEEAVADYEAFAAQPAAAGTYDDTAFRIQAANCYAKAGRPERAKQLIEPLFSATGPQAPRQDALMRALLTLVEEWTTSADLAAGAKATHEFLDQYGSRIKVNPYDMHRFEFNQRLLAFARKASDGKEQTLAIRLISLMASASDAVAYLVARSEGMTSASEFLTEEIKRFTAMMTAPESLDWIAQLSLAASYERGGNPAGAFAIYQRCLQEVPESPHRENIVFGAMRTALVLRHVELAQELGTVFRKEFPKSEYAGIVTTMQLESLFFSRQYQEAMGLASSIRGTLAEDSADRDLADFVVGASLFYLDRPLEAQPELESHAERFPKSRFAEHVRYFAASAQQKLRDWKKGGELLDSFIKDFPNSEYLGVALMDRGTCHFQLGEYQPALDVLGELQKQVPNFANLDMAIAMRGDAHLMLGNHDQAEAAYLKAKELAEAAGPEHQVVLSRILVQLVRTAKALDKTEDILKYYNEYMASHKGGFYDAEIIVSSIAALKEAKRGEEALGELERVIISLGSGESGSGIEEAIGSYTEHFVEVSGAEPLLEKLQNFVPRGVEVNNTLRAWLIMARIDLLQDDQYKDQFPRRAAQVQVAFEELREFNKKELATYILVQVGRNLAAQDKPETNALAVEWFDAVLERGISDHYPLALMGKARILATGGDASAFKDAIDAFDQVIRDLKDKPDYVEEAMLAKARLHFDKGNWKEAETVLFNMQGNSAFTRYRPEVFFRLARAYEEQGKIQEALDAYTPFVGPPFENYVDYSAEARVRAVELVVKQGDKAKAFRLIKDTVSRMYKLNNHPVAGPHVEKAKQLYSKLKAETNAPASPDEGIWGVR